MSKFAFLTVPSDPRSMSAGDLLGLDYVHSRSDADVRDSRLTANSRQ